VSNDTSRWLPLKAGAEDTTRPLVLDYSKLRPAPAGRDGFVKCEKGKVTVGGIRSGLGENLGWKMMDMDKPGIERFLGVDCPDSVATWRESLLSDNSWANNIFETARDNTLTVDLKS